MKTLTVMTPTYNRAELLKDAYASLAAQSCDDFVWMIVDDGSTDDTERVVEGFIADGKVKIEYIKKENGGKHTAVNLAINRVETELIALCLDSDDAFTDSAVEEIISVYNKTEKAYNGYVFLREGRVDHIDPDLEVMSWRQAIVEDRFWGETVIVLKKEYIKQFAFPVFEGEKLCTEAIVWLQMTDPFYWYHNPVCTGEYMTDGYSKNIWKTFAASARSHMLYNDIRLSLWKSFPKRCKFAAYYDGFALFAGERHFIRRCSSKGFAAAALPFGAVFELLLKLKNR